MKSWKTRNPSAVGLLTETTVDDLPHSHAENEFYLWFDLENDGHDEEARYESNDKFQDDDGNDRDNGFYRGL